MPAGAGLEVPGFFAQATKSGRRCHRLEIPASPKPAAPKSKRAHRHLVLAPPEEDAPVSRPAPAAPARPVTRAAGKRKPPRPPAPLRMSEEETFARLAQHDPDPNKKRKTVHKPGCRCFLCHGKPGAEVRALSCSTSASGCLGCTAAC